MSQKLNEIINVLEKRLQLFVDYRKQKKWKFKAGKLVDAEKLEYNDTYWEVISLPYSWDEKKDAWFRKRIIIPESINGFSVAGSTVEIFSSVITSVMPIATELFIDERKVFFAEHWADFRSPRIPVSPRALPGEEHIIVIHALAGEGLPVIPLIELGYSKVEDIVFELASFLEELKFAKELTGGKEVVEKAIADIEPKNIFTVRPPKLLTTVKQVRSSLTPLKSLAKQYIIHLIGHAHIDMNWLWPWEETVKVCRRDFDTVMQLMKEYPGFRFSQSQAVTYKTVEGRFPRLFGKIKQRVNEGRWEVTSSTWVEGDLNMANGEAIVRQILYGKRYVKEKFGVEPKICWEPDTFGHPWSMPQILKKSGIDYYYFMRCGKGAPMFWWEGPDGSRVLAFNSVYNAFINPKELAQLSKDFKRRFGIKKAMFVYGVGDHGGGPTREDIKIAHKLNEKAVFPNLKFSTTTEFFKAISKEELNLPVVKDELNFIWDGCYTTHGDIKKHNRKCERLLLDAEVIGSVAKLLGNSYPDLTNAWEKTLFNQFHDILPGSAVGVSYEYSNKLAKEAEKRAEKIISDSLSAITKNVQIKSKGLPILVFNSVGWERDDIVSIALPESTFTFPIVKDEQENICPVQILNGKLLFIAQKVPSLGYKVFYITEGKREEDYILKNTFVLENEFFTLEIDGESGTIASLYDKKNRKAVMKRQRDEATLPEEIESTTPIINNLLQVLYELPHSMSAWRIGPISSTKNLITNPEIKVISSGPVVGEIRVKHKFNNSTITQDICLYNGLPRIDFITNIDWQEVADRNTEAPMLKVSFTPILNKTEAAFEIPFGHIERIADGREMPALQWVDISDNFYGVSLLSDTKYGFDISGNTMRMTLVRTSYEPDPRADVGEHNFKYALYPHQGNWKSADTVKRGYELNHPLIAMPVSSKEGGLPSAKSFIKVNPPSIIMSCLKKAEDSDDLILRVYESKGEKTEVNIDLDFSVEETAEVDLLERTTEPSSSVNSRLSFSIGPYEIKTFRVKGEWCVK